MQLCATEISLLSLQTNIIQLWFVQFVATTNSTFYNCGGATGTALDLRSTVCGFKSYSGQKLRNNLGQVVHTYVHLSPSSITWYWPRGGDALWLGR